MVKCDLSIIGSGPAGIGVALKARELGLMPDGKPSPLPHDFLCSGNATSINLASR
ncbi:MAG: hypothetical protein LBS86_07445 [Treponema sp.]|nr:hypothetical protein [Treponema sp.]